MAPAQKSKLPLVAGLLMLGIAIAAGGFLWTRTAHKPEPVVAARTVRFSINTEPAGARVVRAADHREIGKTPWTSSQAAATGPLILVLKLDGYAEKVVTVDQSESVMIAETLKPLASSGTVSQPTLSPPPSTPPPPEPGLVKGRGKKGKGKAGPGAAPTTSAVATAAPTPPVATTPNPTSKPPTPSKDESSHGRIQMVD
jgi:hypothetical protein